MAFGDPMVLRTLYNGGYGAVSHDSLLIDGPMEDGLTGTDWAWNFVSATPAIASAAGVRTGGGGSNIHRLTFTTPGTGTLGDYNQSVGLRGNSPLSGYGHNGLTFNGTIWVRRTDAGAGLITAVVKMGENAFTTTGSSQNLTSIGTWYQLDVSRALTATNSQPTLTLKVDLSYATGGGSPVIELDDAILYHSYTFAVNAAMPDEPRLIAPGRSFQRAPGGTMIEHRSATVTCNKHEYTLHFGLVGLAQLKSLRSLWLLDSPMEWQPNLPHLPTYLDVRFTGDFNLRMRSPSVNSNNYYGTLTLAEI